MILPWIAMGVAGVLLAALLTGAAAGLYGAHKIFARRYNGNPDVRYFRAEDFEGLSAEPVSFDSGGVALRGYVYTREGEKKGAVIFSHGFGAGHFAYTTEIDRLTRSGFAVLAFDNAACAESGGAALKGFDGGVADLLAAVKFSRTHPLLKDLPKAMFGHSWGGFSVINAFPQCDDVGFAAAITFLPFHRHGPTPSLSPSKTKSVLRIFRTAYSDRHFEHVPTTTPPHTTNAPPPPNHRTAPSANTA